MKLFFVLGTLLLLVVCSAIPLHAQEERPPNIILIIGDDHGYPYFGFTGSEHVKTPNMDLLANEGATFTLGHVTDNYCRPSLQTLMTGLYPLQYNAVADRYHAEYSAADAQYADASADEKRDWDLEFYFNAMQHFTTLPDRLENLGYASFQGGKWWEQSYATGGFTEGMSQGWEMADRSQPGWFEEFMGGEGMALGRETMDPVYDFIDRHEEQPFFIWYGPSLPHTPLNPPFRHYKYYANTDFSESAKEYYANCTWFDEGVGQLIDYVEAKGLRENTIMVYVNDNGWEQPPYDEYKDSHILYSNGGPKGKLALHDLSFRTPIIFHWPGYITADRFETDLVSSVDIVPTLLDYVGLDIPGTLPGHSLRPIIEKRNADKRDYLIGRITQLRSDSDVMGFNANGYYLRTPTWHFMWFVDTEQMELYNMIDDPDATANVIAEQPVLVEQFQSAIRTWEAEILANLPE